MLKIIFSKKFLKIFVLLLLIETLILGLVLSTYTIKREDILVKTQVFPYSYTPKAEFLGKGKLFHDLVLFNRSFEEIYAERGKLVFRFPLNLPLNFRGNLSVRLSLRTVYELEEIALRLVGQINGYDWNIVLYSVSYGSYESNIPVNISQTINFNELIRKLNGLTSILMLEIIFSGYDIVVVKIENLVIKASSSRGIIKLVPVLADAYGDNLYSDISDEDFGDIMLRVYPAIFISIWGNIYFYFHDSNSSLVRVAPLWKWYFNENNITGESIYICLGDQVEAMLEIEMGNLKITTQLPQLNLQATIPEQIKIWLPIFYLTVYLRGCKKISNFVSLTANFHGYDLSGDLQSLEIASKIPKGIPIVFGGYDLIIYIFKPARKGKHYEFRYGVNFCPCGDAVLEIYVKLYDVLGLILPLYPYLFVVSYIAQVILGFTLIIAYILKRVIR